MKNHSLFVLVLLGVVASLSSDCHAQKISMVSSTERHWSGGIAGHRGVNYTFSIRFEAFRNAPEPDTIWIGNEPIPILIKGAEPNRPFNTTITRFSKSVQFDISAGTAKDDYADRYAPYSGKKEEEKPQPPIEYHGAAMISYKVDGKKRYYVINKIMHKYPPVNYP
jgi:hypothetical protein